MTGVARTGEVGVASFRDPRSVTVVGASADPVKWGHWLARGALNGEHRRDIHLVNRRGHEILGRASHRSVLDIPGDLDLVVLSVPPTEVPVVVDACLAKGARAFLGITAGIDRALNRPGLEHELAERIRGAGARLIGPNCLGIYDAATELQLAWGEFSPGALGVVSQSGQLGSELTILAGECGLGVSRFVSVGNQADVTAHEVLSDLVDHEQTRVIALYVESFVNGRDLAAALRALRDAGKHTILLTVGGSAASKSAAKSHTGALTSALDVVDAACRAAGVVRVDTPAQVVDVAQMLVDAPLPRGRRTVIVGDSGGQGAVAADVLSRMGLEMAPLHDRLRADLAACLPADAGLANPVDLAGAGEQDMTTYATVVERLLDDATVDAVAITGYFGSYGFHAPSLNGAESRVALRIADASRRAEKPVVLHSMCRDSATIDLIRARGVPAYHSIETAGLGLGHAVSIMVNRGRTLQQLAPRGRCQRIEGYLAARGLLEAAGVRFPAAERVTDRESVEKAAANLRAPYVLKADWVLHKTEVGGVAVGLGDSAAAVQAYKEMSARLGRGGYVLEEMDARPDTVEMIVGGRRDPVFGPTVMVGGGGTTAELFRDSTLELAPVDIATAQAMIGRLRSGALLSGWRGRPGIDTSGLAMLIVTVSELICELPWCSDLELNPVRVGSDAVMAVDALVTTDFPDRAQEVT